jgi:altronate hydrolase
MGNKILQIHPDDNAVVALVDLHPGEVFLIGQQSVVIKNKIPAKHKFTAIELKRNESIIMYGSLVGKSTAAIDAGSLLNTGNVAHATLEYAYSNYKYQWQPPDISHYYNRNFYGYHRNDGAVGTANYWIFMPTVFCENRNLDIIKEAFQEGLGYAVSGKYKNFVNDLATCFITTGDIMNVEFSPVIEQQKRLFKNIDGIKFLNHQGGCGGIRQDAAMLSKLLAAYANHPNVAGVTVLSLGCQNLQVEDFRNDLKKMNSNFDKPLFIFEQQHSKSEEELIVTAIKKTFEGLIKADKIERKPAPLSKLCVGVKCGGSDGFSGISANPAVGYCADLLVALGAKVLLAEFPELCGVEQNLIDRMANKANAEKFASLMQNFENGVIKAGSGFHMNPSPGNIKDGLITDAMKSAGAAKKGGTSPVVDVLDYAEPALKPGLSLVCTPGNDVEATTGKAAAGATLILFTTGLGTPTGNPVCPTIKISSNSALAVRMKDIIDIDTGPIIAGKKSIAAMGEEILEYCIKVASGEAIPAAVRLNQDDFIPWKRGVSL